MKIATVLQAAATLVGAFSDLDLERNSIEVPRIGQDVNVTCGGKEIRIEVSPHYIQRNSAWLGDGSFLRILLAIINENSKLGYFDYFNFTHFIAILKRNKTIA
jgi:hypothetical protein